MMDAAEQHGHDLSSFTSFMVGAASVPPSLVERAERVGIPVYRAYGSSEHPVITTGCASDPLGRSSVTLSSGMRSAYTSSTPDAIRMVSAERRVSPMRDLDMDRGAPIGHQIDFDEGTRRVDVSHFGMEIIAAVALMFDLQ